MGNAQISSCHWWERTEKHECSGLADLFDFHTHKIMYIFLQPAHTKACTKEVRIINGRSPWVSPGATKEGLQKRPQKKRELTPVSCGFSFSEMMFIWTDKMV